MRGHALAALMPGTLLLAACASLQAPPTLPLAAGDLCRGALPAGYQVQALLSVRGAQHGAKRDEKRGEVSAAPAQHFFLALDTRPDSRQLNLMTLQGVPLYRLSCAGEQAREQSQARVEGIPSPSALAAWLASIYGATELAGTGWREPVPAGPGRRQWQYTGSRPRSIDIHTEGPPPWFEKVSLSDPAGDIHLELTLQESRHVLPE
ncbi:MAG: hypothetical protein ACK5HY_05700 [Parahaliea sp.]